MRTGLVLFVIALIQMAAFAQSTHSTATKTAPHSMNSGAVAAALSTNAAGSSSDKELSKIERQTLKPARVPAVHQSHANQNVNANLGKNKPIKTSTVRKH
jgi:hypothetical protein